MHYPNGRILVFAKAPLPGYAKTRLIPVLGPQGAADLQARLIRRTVDLALTSRLAPVELWVSGDNADTFFAPFRAAVDGRIHVQTGPNLGARMGDAFERSLREAEFAVLVGTDCPAMQATHLESACAALAADSDVVLGPAEDGGYVLIGLRRAEPRIFDGVAWGTPAVLRQTRAHIVAAGLRCHELPMLWDLDVPEDLTRFAEL